MQFKKLLVANRGEIAIRVLRAATELGLRTVAIFADEDKLSLHRFKADEAYQLGRNAPRRLGPVDAYLSIPEILEIAVAAKVDAIHPGYGFLSESPEFAEACALKNIAFIGPSPSVLRTLGNKISARNLAVALEIPVVPASGTLPTDDAAAAVIAESVGYPLMLKASWGGGGRGMRVVEAPAELKDAVRSARQESKLAFGKDEIYVERLVRHARHVEVQILGDLHGKVVHLYERDCSIQRRNQKIIERAPAPYLDNESRAALLADAVKIGVSTRYAGAGTVEFLIDRDSGKHYFMEVNPRVQVEHTVTEQVTGLDIVKAQILIAGGGRIGVEAETGIPEQPGVSLRGHAVQCRITTEDPENNFVPDYGRITAYRGAFGFGIRVDGGTAYSGAVISRYYDPLLEKVTAWAPTASEAADRMSRALREYRIRGIATNLTFLDRVINHPAFRNYEYTTKFVDTNVDLTRPSARRDRASKLLEYIADISINGHKEVQAAVEVPRVYPRPPSGASNINGRRGLLKQHGPEAFAKWMRSEARLLVCDTTMRDAHQSLLATRLRTTDIAAVAPAYSAMLPNLLSLECWGGATFDVAMRFLHEDPWERLAAVRTAAPNIPLQMLLRGVNAVGYTNYSRNVVEHFIRNAARGGIDIFRIFDCMNSVESMRVAIDAVAAENCVAEGAICYTGNILDPRSTKFTLKYYVELAKSLESAGCHIIAIKDMAGLLKPIAATMLVQALRDAVSLPVRLHTHDTSGVSAATVMAAVAAGVDGVDAAMDSMSGTTSQPCLGSIVEALNFTQRDTGLDTEAIRKISWYWEQARRNYSAFEADMKGGSSEVYLHEIPGGQITNLREQAKGLGLEHKWPEIADAYRAANELLGNIIKVTPSSKVVGDLALMMVAQGLNAAELMNPAREVSFPSSVTEMLRGSLGVPDGGWPPALVQRVLGRLPDDGAHELHATTLATDLDAAKADAEKRCGRQISDCELSSYLMYPKVFTEFAAVVKKYGPLSALPTATFYCGMRNGDEISVEIEKGKALVIRLLGQSDVNDEGEVKVFFELNGQPRTVVVTKAGASRKTLSRKADLGNANHVAATVPGAVASIVVRAGQRVKSGDALLMIESMKMEVPICAPRDAVIDSVMVSPGQTVDAKDLLVTLVA